MPHVYIYIYSYRDPIYTNFIYGALVMALYIIALPKVSFPLAPSTIKHPRRHLLLHLFVQGVLAMCCKDCVGHQGRRQMVTPTQSQISSNTGPTRNVPIGSLETNHQRFSRTAQQRDKPTNPQKIPHEPI